MPVDDPQQFRKRFARQQELLEESDTIHEPDRDAIRRWIRAKDGSVAVSTMELYLRRLRKASEMFDAPLVGVDEGAYQDLVFALRHDHGYADSTVQSFENVILQFLSDISSEGVGWHDGVERTKVDRRTVDPSEVLAPADIQALITAASHDRDIALIEFFADTGVRLSLALSLRIKDVHGVDSDTPTFVPNRDALGLKGAPITGYPLLDSVAPIRSYLRGSHPRANEPDVALFHKIKPARLGADGERWTDDGGPNPHSIREQLHRIADRAGVEKPINPHAFRHAAITRMVREGYTRSQIEHRVCWTLDSDMWEVYEHITGEEHTDDIFRAAGVLEKEDGPDRIRKRCGNCRSPVAPHHDYCPNCGAPQTASARETKQQAVGDVSTEMVNVDDMSRREFRAHVLQHIESDAGSLDHADPPSTESDDPTD